MTDKDNTPAFPVFPETSGGHAAAFTGMTLRDYFAAKAMQSMVTARAFPFDEGIPALSYKIADAMLKERAK